MEVGPLRVLLDDLDPEERRVYERLQMTETTAPRIAESDFVPPERAAQLLEGLVHKGFVRSQAGRPTLYRAVPPEEILARYPLPEVRPGYTYLVEEAKPRLTVLLFSRLMGSGYAGFVVTRMPPDRVKEGWGFAGEVLWLRKEDDVHSSVDHVRLDYILRTLRGFLAAHPRGVILLDGLEYLTTRYQFQQVLRFIHDMREFIALSQAVLLVPVDSRAFVPRDLALLEREMEILTSNGLRPKA